MAARRALHYVLKIGDRDASIRFYRDLLGMTPLRHEEFEGGCEATCNGPYDNKWSKTMIGYGPEDTNFVLELTYNYTVGSYKLGNDLVGLTLALPQATYDAVKATDPDSKGYVTAPDGYKFFYQLGSQGETDDFSHISYQKAKKYQCICSWRDQGFLELQQLGRVHQVLERSAGLEGQDQGEQMRSYEFRGGAS